MDRLFERGIKGYFKGTLYEPRTKSMLDYINRNGVKKWCILYVRYYQPPRDEYTSIAYIVKLNNPKYPYAVVWITSNWSDMYNPIVHIHFISKDMLEPLSRAISSVLGYISEHDILEDMIKRHRGLPRKKLEDIMNKIKQAEKILRNLTDKPEKEIEELLDKYFKPVEKIII